MADDINKQDFLDEVRRRFEEAYTAEAENRENTLDDLKVLDGDQWDGDIKANRIANKRPVLTINQLPKFLDQVVGDQRLNKPQITVKPVDSKSDPETAKVLSGLIRNIQDVSDSDIAVDHAFEHAAAGGAGCFEIVTEYNQFDVFEQDIKIKRVQNALSVLFDPAAEDYDRSDGDYCFKFQDIKRETYKKRWPDKEFLGYEEACDTEGMALWYPDGESVRVAKYWRKEPKKRVFTLLQDGTVIETETTDDERIVESLVETNPKTGEKYQRTVDSYEIYEYIVSSHDILEGPTLWPSKYFPLIPVWGKELNVGGARKVRGTIRHAKDPARIYNYSRSTEIELTALAPKTPYLLTPKMVAGHESKWKESLTTSFPFLLFNPDPNLPGQIPYQRNPGMLPPAETQQSMIARNELMDTTGIYEAGLGQKSNEKSGVAVRERKREGDTGSFAYIDNLARSMKHAGRVVLDLIPAIYDTPRVVRIINPDDKDEFIRINQPIFDKDGKVKAYHDVTRGKYDVAVTVGPSYTTQRQEAADGMLRFIEAIPQIGPIVVDLLAKNMDWPGADDLVTRLEKTLPPEVRGGEDGKDAPAMPDPAMIKQLVDKALQEAGMQEQQLKIQQEQAKVEKAKLEVEEAKIELQQKMMELGRPQQPQQPAPTPQPGPPKGF